MQIKIRICVPKMDLPKIMEIRTKFSLNLAKVKKR